MKGKAIDRQASFKPAPPSRIQLLLLPGEEDFPTAPGPPTVWVKNRTGMWHDFHRTESSRELSLCATQYRFRAGNPSFRSKLRPGHCGFCALGSGERGFSAAARPEDSCDERDSRGGRRGHPRNELGVLSSGPCLPLIPSVTSHLTSPPGCAYL